jgi:hypothetical protein
MLIAGNGNYISSNFALQGIWNGKSLEETPINEI